MKLFLTARKPSRALFCWLLVVFLLTRSVGSAAGTIELNVILHEIQLEPVRGQLMHRVEARVSVLDVSGSPVRDLPLSNFTVLEDSKQVEAKFVEDGSDEPISIVMVMDTSGSMAGVGIDKARAAAVHFLERLDSTNRVAVVSFNQDIEVLSEFNSPGVAQSALLSLQVKPNAGTCLYDAIYQSLNLVSVQPPGRRALLVMTDGRDELPNSRKPCSSAVIDDVTHMASATLPTPIYLMGVGKEIDENSLGRIALLTGGSFLKADDFSQLDERINNLFDQLKNQYVLEYVSVSVPGKHTLTVQVSLGGAKDQDTRDFLMSELPPVLQITGAPEGESLNARTTLTAEVSGQKEAVARLEWVINDTPAGAQTAPPFQIEIDPKGYPSGTMKVEAHALDGDGKELSSDVFQLVIPAREPEASVATPTPLTITAEPAIIQEPGPTVEPTSSTETAVGTVPVSWVAGGMAFFVLVAGAVYIGARRSGRKQNLSVPPTEDFTMDAQSAGVAAGQAELVVIFSDDPAIIGRRFPVKPGITTIGRGTGSDVVFPLDQPVSRRHAAIELRAGQYYLNELLSGDGMQKPPTFGSFVNNQRLSGAPVPLFPGAEIRLGSRLCLRFNAPDLVGKSSVPQDGETIDEVKDETID